MTQDGGCIESLNVHLDGDEIAPALKPTPKDITVSSALKWSDAYIHKTPNYENYILVTEGRVVAKTATGEKGVLTLKSGEKVNSITSVGNTLVIATSLDLYYILYKDRKYNLLGTKLPFPHINVYAEHSGSGYLAIHPKNDPTAGCNSKEEWDDEDFNEAKKRDLIAEMWPLFDQKVMENISDGKFTHPRMLRYAIELYDGSRLSSMPLIVGAASYEPGVVVDCEKYFVAGYATTNTVSINYSGPYTISAQLVNKEILSDWLDVVKSIKIYISQDFYSGIDRQEIPKCDRWEVREVTETTPDGEEFYGDETHMYFNLFDHAKGFDKILAATAPCFLLKEIPIESTTTGGILSEEIESLSKGISLKPEGDAFPEKVLDDNTTIIEDNLATQEALIDDDIQHYILNPERMSTYNNRLALVGVKRMMLYDYSNLGFYVKNSSGIATSYQVEFVIEGINEDKIVHSDIINTPAGFQLLSYFTFPDSRCNRARIKATRNGTTLYRSFEMKPHPLLNCAYYVGTSTDSFVDLYGHGSTSDTSFRTENRVDDSEGKLYFSDINKPFLFPASGTYTFQGNPLGIAIATTALSQGQFGQFPLYIFTEDGIWAMEVAADGTFVSSKPLSREVCSNPNSITSIDQAVLFVTQKGLMMLQGSEIVCLSEKMNGRHVTLEAGASSILSNVEGFGYMLPAVNDTRPFLSYIQAASIAYDYSGKRIICINANEPYQYVYEFSTQSWHKLSHEGLTLVEPLNSYPTCEVLAKKANGNSCIVDLMTVANDESHPEKGVIITRPLDLENYDILKTIQDVRIRGQFPKGAVKFILLGSQDGIHFYPISTLRGKSWKLFKIAILADLDVFDRISWIDVMYETKFTNKLR
jgi:hypothetical protein